MELDLYNSVFTYKQLYAALSKVQSKKNNYNLG